VLLSSDNALLSLPFPSLTVPAGANSATFMLTASSAPSPQSATLQAIALSSVLLSWTASVSPSLIYYKIYRGTTSSGPFELLTTLPLVTTYSDYNVQARQTYYYVAAAVNDTGAESAYSDVASAVIPAPAPQTATLTLEPTPYSIVVVGGFGQSATVTKAFGSPLVALVRDQAQNPVPNATVTFTAPSSGASGTFANGTVTTQVTTDSLGHATSTTFTANTVANNYNVQANVSGVNSLAHFNLTNTAGPAASLTATAGTPQSANVNTAFAVYLRTTVKDTYGNVVPNVQVGFTAPSSGASATFSNSTNTITASTNGSGIASALPTANSVAGSYSVTAALTGVSPSATFSLTNQPGIPASVAAYSGSNQSASINTAFTNPLVALVRDRYNNPVSGVTVTFTPATSGASGSFASRVNTATTNVQGLATSAVFTANGTPGNYNVTASVNGASPASFSLTNLALTAVINVTSTTANGTYGPGAVIPVVVTFSRRVKVTGVPLLALNSGGTALYTSGNGTAALTFTYSVAAEQNTPHLDEASSSALTLNGGAIADFNGVTAILRLPAPGTAGSLGFNTAIAIDTTAPVVTSYQVMFGSESYNVIGTPRNDLPWQITGIKVVFSKPIAQGNANSLTGVTVAGFSGLGTNTLTWTINPLSLGNFATALLGAGANALKDAAGNALAGGDGFSQNLKVLWGDYNDDGLVNAQDLAGVNSAISVAYNIFADMNGDGVVNLVDVAIVRTRIGTSLQ
jgi:hypothetical protein